MVERKVLVSVAVAVAGALAYLLTELAASDVEWVDGLLFLVPVLQFVAGRQVSNANIAPSSVAAAKLEGKI